MCMAPLSVCTFALDMYMCVSCPTCGTFMQLHHCGVHGTNVPLQSLVLFTYICRSTLTVPHQCTLIVCCHCKGVGV